MMGREVRRVPPNWEHPKDEQGDYIPMHEQSYEDARDEWLKGLADWKPSEHDGEDYWEWEGNPPTRDDHMPKWSDEERTHYQMYEDTTEGTPISPVMETPEELARWLVDNNASSFASMTASYEAWLRVCRGGFAPSMVFRNGKLMNGVDGANED